jgi:hypothetical protein
MNRIFALGLFALSLTALSGGCGATPIAPGTRSTDDVQAAGMSRTFAGKNKCNPKTADRPFIIEWDATDMSSFESHAANDVIFVKYEGCDLKVIDACVVDSVKGAFGSYKPVEWTSGSLESMDLNDEGDLYAKLPLGAATLSGRVEGGEKFHMEYFVSGTRSATRDAVYRADLAKVPACAEATHFVYGYNLGAFALGSQSSIKGSVEGSVFGFGAGADRSHVAKADKQGGVLASCHGESARELDTCKVPIRLTLREISGGESVDATAAQAPETSAALNLAGKIQASNDRERKANALLQSAIAKAQARDGKGCIADLDQHDQLDPRPQYLSTAPMMGQTRAQCLMLAGQCATGKTLARKSFEKNLGGSLDAEGIDRAVEGFAAQYCQGGTMSPRDQLLKAKGDLERGAFQKKMDKASCMQAYETMKRLIPLVKPENDSDTQVKTAPMFLRNNIVGCLARAGECDAAWDMYQKVPNPLMPAGFVQPPAAVKAQYGAATQSKCQAPL